MHASASQGVYSIGDLDHETDLGHAAAHSRRRDAGSVSTAGCKLSRWSSRRATLLLTRSSACPTPNCRLERGASIDRLGEQNYTFRVIALRWGLGAIIDRCRIRRSTQHLGVRWYCRVIVMAHTGRPGLSADQKAEIVASMETWAVVERGRPCTRQARELDSWRGVIERRVHSCRSEAVALGADARGARRDFSWHGDGSLHRADRGQARASAVDRQPGNQPPWWGILRRTDGRQLLQAPPEHTVYSSTVASARRAVSPCKRRQKEGGKQIRQGNL